MIERLAALARSPRGPYLVAAWACAEAVLWPIVPDVVLLPLVAAAPRSTPRLLVALFAGALIGSAILAGLVVADETRVRSALDALPGIEASTLPAVEAEIATQGAGALAQLGPGVPLKVYTTAWIADGGSPVVLAGAVVVNRVTRIGPGILLAALIGWLLPGLLRRFERIAAAAYVLAWLGLYVVYWRLV